MNKESILRNIGSLPNSTYVFVVITLVCAAGIPNFASANNISTLLQQSCILTLLSVAMALSIITKGIDLSVGGVVSFAGIIMALLMSSGAGEGLAILIGFIAAMVFGFLNGFIIVKLKVAPFIATFGMMGIAQGVANLLSNKRAIYLTDQAGLIKLRLIPFLRHNLLEIDLGGGQILGINMIVVITAAVLVLLLLLYKKTVLSAYMYALGNNAETAKLSNINVDFWNIFVYMLTGLLAGIASLLMLLRLNSAQPTAGDGLEFQAVVAAVLGGNPLSGGKGSLPGAIMGALTVFVVRNGLTLVGANSNFIMIILGVVLVLGMIMNDVASRGFKAKGACKQ
ncbi:MAG: ABC transporter permease [Spirochaetia bacterium]|jgi:ribose/xylose/arabinose/galactoside ABC-type transport system permease subunit|nr:ABC transporter permease [Spirochaetia bacterium]